LIDAYMVKVQGSLGMLPQQSESAEPTVSPQETQLKEAEKALAVFKLDNDVTFRLDYSLRDDATSNSKLDQSTAFGTGGQKVVRIAPSIDYVVNKRVNIKFYYEQNKIEPKIATTAPVTNTRAGVQIRISLTP